MKKEAKDKTKKVDGHKLVIDFFNDHLTQSRKTFAQ